MTIRLRLAMGIFLLLACAPSHRAQEFLWRASVKAPVEGNPVVGGDGSTYLACRDERVRAYDPRGNPTWTFVLNAKVAGQMALQDGILYVPTRASAIEAVGTNGHRAWEYRLPTHIVGAPAVSSAGDIYFNTDDNFLYCINGSGGLRWREPLPGFVTQGPVIGPDGTVLLGCKDAVLAYGSDGRRLWKYTYLGNLAAPLAVGPTGHVLAVANDGRLYCLDPEGGEAWTFDGIAASMAPLVTEDRVYLVDSSSILSIDLDTGELDWEQGVTASGSPALGEDGVLYVPTKDASALVPPARVPAAAVYKISGIVSGASSVTMTLSGASTASTQTDSGGNYTFSNLDLGNYVVTPTKTGYSFTPSSRPVTIEGLDVTGINFVATTAPTYAISGTVTLDGSPIEGVAVTTRGASATTGTDGKYQLTGLVDGSYTVVPTKAGYNFSPKSQTVAISGADKADVNFAAATVAGHVKLLDINDGGAVLPTGLDIKASGGDISLSPSPQGGGRVVVLNSVPKLFCYAVPAGPVADAWSQAGAGPRRQSRMDTAPSVVLLTPEAGQTVQGTVGVEADVSDTDLRGVTAYLTLDGARVASVSRPPFYFSWYTEGTPDGAVEVGVEVVDLAGNSGSDSVQVEVDNGAPPPLAFYADDPPQTFIWVAPAYENRFAVQCAKDPAFENRVASSAIDKGGWLRTASWTPSSDAWKGVLSVGKGASGDATGHWRVIGKESGSFYYGTYAVKAQVSAAPLGPPDASSVPASAPPTFTWSANHNRRFRVEFSDSEDFSTGVKVDSATDGAPWLGGASWKPSPKRWNKIVALGPTVYWRVTAKDSIGRTLDGETAYSLTVN